jgi:hypothetical protein
MRLKKKLHADGVFIETSYSTTAKTGTKAFIQQTKDFFKLHTWEAYVETFQNFAIQILKDFGNDPADYFEILQQDKTKVPAQVFDAAWMLFYLEAVNLHIKNNDAKNAAWAMGNVAYHGTKAGIRPLENDFFRGKDQTKNLSNGREKHRRIKSPLFAFFYGMKRTEPGLSANEMFERIRKWKKGNPYQDDAILLWVGPDAHPNKVYYQTTGMKSHRSIAARSIERYKKEIDTLLNAKKLRK